MEVKDEVRTAATVHCIVVIHKNKTKLKRLKIKQDGKSEVEKVDEEVDEEKEEEEVPLKRKWQGEEETSRSKRAKSSRPRNL